jgi:hypothetical protein
MSSVLLYITHDFLCGFLPKKKNNNNNNNNNNMNNALSQGKWFGYKPRAGYQFVAKLCP